MSTPTKKKISFSLIKTILLIKDVKMLNSLYKGKFDVDFEIIISKMDFDLITSDMRDFMKDTFSGIIVKNEEYTEKYAAIVVPEELKDFDIRSKIVVPRRITVEYLMAKKEREGLTENERMTLYSIKLKQLAARIHNMGKHGKCTDDECKSVISGIQTMFKKAEPVLSKYGRKGEWNFEE